MYVCMMQRVGTRVCFFWVVAIGVLLSLQSMSAQKLCDVTSIGLRPLVDMRTETWNGILGGLYPEGSRNLPFEAEEAFRDYANDIRPCNAQGYRDNHNGTLAMVGFGSTDASAAFDMFAMFSVADTTTSRRIRYVNACAPGLSLSDLSTETASTWDVVRSKVSALGIEPAQVQVAWVMLDELENADTVFPRAAEQLADRLTDFCRALKSVYPAVRVVYFSSRPYSGYVDPTMTSLDAGAITPRDHIHGWGVKMLIERQLRNEPGYDYLASKATIPALLWSSYLWADGENANADGLKWLCTDFEADGYTLSADGAVKAGVRLASFFSNNIAARGWYTRVLVASVNDGADTPRLRAEFNGATLMLEGTESHVTVVDLRGKAVWAGPVDRLATIDAQEWPTGVYVVRSSNATTLVQRRR